MHGLCGEVNAYQVPEGYGETRIVLQVRDPFWMHAYWEISRETALDLARELGESISSSRLTLRVNDMTMRDEADWGKQVAIDVHPFANNWYINVCEPDTSYCVDLGLTHSADEFRFIARSNVVHTPRVGPSEVRDEEWLSIRALEAVARGPMVYTASPGMPAQRIRAEEWAREIALGSGGVGAISSPVGPPVPTRAPEMAGRQYWLRADAELVVYGATEPGSQVSVSGMPVNLASDGTFSVRIALPVGELPIEVAAESADRLMSRHISWTVARTGLKDGR
ncbi:MAG TPA: DUF4912 domain-containing protein [Bacillota bacterium]|nr:DUF4912 domain-containing protein [Bacillota bacterium]